MYIGHLVPALAALSVDPSLPPVASLLATTWVDLICGVFVTLGIDRVSLDRTAGPYMFMRLDFVDWDHSLAAAVTWSVLLGALFAGCGAQKAATMALLSFLHWPLDWLVHNTDLALYPHSDQHFGFGAWGRYGAWAWLGEGALIVIAAALASRHARQQRGADWSAIWPLLIGPFALMSPWTSPTLFLHHVPSEWHRYVQGASLAVGFIGPCTMLARALSDAEHQAPGRRKRT